MVSVYETFRHMFTAHAQKRLFMSFRSKIWPCHSLRRPRFPIRRVYFHYRMTFAAYIWWFCAQFSFDLVTLIFDIGDVWWIKLHISNARTNFSILRLSVPELWATQYDHITITWNGHCACAVSRDLSPGGGNDSHFWNPWTQFVYSLCHFRGATTKRKPCYRPKKSFPIEKATEFTAHAQYHVTCA